MEWQPVVTLIAAIIAAGTSALTLLKLQDKKRNDDVDLKAFDHSLDERLKEFEQKLIGDNSYLAEKGKNTATREDIEEITRKIESIKSEFETPTELLRWQLSKKATLHRLQAEKEFEVYSKLWNIATDLRLAFEELRPMFDPQPLGTDRTELRIKRLKEITKSRNELLIEVEKQRPFYSETLYFELRKLVQQGLNEILDFERSIGRGRMTPEANLRGQKNLNEFVESLNKVCELIKTRIIES